MIFKNYSKYIYFGVGLILLCFALPLNVHSLLGSDPLSCVNMSLSLIFNIEFGTALFIVNMIFVLLHFLYFRNVRFAIGGIISAILSGALVNLFNDYLICNLPNQMLYQKIIWLLLSYILLCLSIALIQYSKFQKLPFEAFQQIFATIFKKDINFIRVIVEIVCVIIGIILFWVNGINLMTYINIGTLFIMLCTGPGVYFIYKRILKGE